MSEIRLLLRIAEERGGVKPGFSPYHVFRVLDMLHRHSVCGRHELMKELGLGEASIKTLISRLKEAGLVETSRPHGTKLTETGKELATKLKRLIKLIPNLELSEMCMNCRVSGIILSNGYSYVPVVGGVILFRDLVVREGADGVLIITCSGRTLYLPTPSGFEEVRVEALTRLVGEYGVGDGDLIVLGMCYSHDGERCLAAAVNTVLKILAS
ncbi:MAG: DUF4443 domain-containing protein [Zestosphaera sp.]